MKPASSRYICLIKFIKSLTWLHSVRTDHKLAVANRQVYREQASTGGARGLGDQETWALVGSRGSSSDMQ
jgi:hypothetical protein